MKKTLLILFLFGTTLAFGNDPVAEKRPATNNTNEIVQSKLTEEEQEMLIARLNEIQAMDFSAFDRNDKRELRKEVRTIGQKLKQDGAGIYLSGTAIIIIILLLILL